MINDILCAISRNWPQLLFIGLLTVMYLFFLYAVAHQSAERRKSIDEQTRRLKGD